MVHWNKQNDRAVRTRDVDDPLLRMNSEIIALVRGSRYFNRGWINNK